jgi:O-antigen/teichoic acid export membrane protein
LQTGSSSLLTRTATGSAFLLLRQVLVQVINLIGGIVLARRLGVDEYGFLGVATYSISVLTSLSDVGLTLSLLQQRDSPDDKDFSVIFTAQTILTTVVSAAFLCMIPWMLTHYNLSNGYRVFFLVAAVSFALQVFRAVPQARLERDLHFGKLAVMEIVLSVAYNSCAIILAIIGAGVWSFMSAILLRTILSVAMLNFASPTRLRFAWDRTTLRRHISRGLPMQTAAYISLIKDSMSPVVIGMTLGLSATGIVNMAGTISNVPTYLCAILGRIYLPAFSRVKDSRQELASLFSNAVFVVNSVVAPLSFFVLLFRESFTVIFFSRKWLQTEELYPFIWTANLFVPTAVICMGLLNALGESRKNIYASLVWAILTLGMGSSLIALFGLIGFGFANLSVNLSMGLFFYYVRVRYGHNPFPGIFKGWLPAAVGAVLYLVLVRVVPTRFASALNTIYTGGILYFLMAAVAWMLIHRSKAAMIFAHFSVKKGG